QSRQQLVAEVVSGWFNVITAQQLLELYKQREKIAEQNLAIIESGYRQGLNEALDVYLTRNELNTERSNIAEQQATLTESIRVLERLTGEYP
ncbi:TolC family protein, partial [Shewanella algae]|uniref:TolC family protein n=1 Tax=Shewanella algae TaxID=38313 RepID=UPI00313A90DB